MLSPQQYRALLRFPQLDAFRLDSLKLHISSSSRLAPAEKEAIARRLPGRFCEIYGVTEGGVGTLLHGGDRGKLHTVGKPMAMYRMAILGEDGARLPAGEPGWIAGHSAFMMSRYRDANIPVRHWHDPAAPQLRHFVPGDLGYFDADGYLVVLDRAADTHLLDGRRWFPSVLEAELLACAGCAELAVALRSGDGPPPWPLVVHWAGDDAHQQPLRDALRQHPRFDAELVRWPRLPRNGMGKLLRQALMQPLETTTP